MVTAVASGFYAGQLRAVGSDPFPIASEEDLGSWMQPQHWSPKANKHMKQGQAASKKKDAADESPQGFSGLKETYGEGDFVVTSEEAIAAALEESDMDVKAWNATSVADRKTKIMKKVGELIKAKQEGAAKQE